MVRLEHKTLIFYYLGTEIPKNRSVLIFRGPPGPVCHNQNENSFSQFVRIRQKKIPFLSTKRGSTGTGSSRTQKFFCQKMFQLTPPRCVKKLGHLGLLTPKVWRDLYDLSRFMSGTLVIKIFGQSDVEVGAESINTHIELNYVILIFWLYLSFI